MRNRALHVAAVVALLLTHAGLLAYGAAVHSPCIDEVGHMAAGLSHWRLHKFDLYHVNPPLVRAVATFPVLYMQPKIDWESYSDAPGARTEFDIGRQFISDNGERSFWFFTCARWACIPFSLLGGLVCFLWARELYGDWSGLLALTLWCFDPYMLANGQLITPDMGATALGVTAAYLFWKWLKRPGWALALFTGFALGLAELTKMTWILLFALWPLLWLIWKAPEWRRLSLRNGLSQAGQLALILLIALYVINAGYGDEESMTRLGDYRFVSTSLSGSPETGTVGNRFAGTWMAGLPVPVPANYLQGVDVQKHDFEKHFSSYLFGEWRKQGWWYYYLFALAIKVPLGVWLLALLAAFLGLARRGYAAAWRDELTVLAPGVLVLAFVSAQTGFNHHSRYVLPIFPYFFVWISKAARAVERRERLTVWLAGGAAAWAAASSLLVYPHSLSYFNELIGGPAHGGDYLLDSNIDWGQDLFFLRDWLKEHPEARPLEMAYFGCCDPRVAGIEFTLAPRGDTSPEEAVWPQAAELGPRPGWYAVSVAMRQGCEFWAPDGKGNYPWFALNRFAYFQRFRPVDHAGWSIYIYHITPEECAKVRREMGLPGLAQASAEPYEPAPPPKEPIPTDETSKRVDRSSLMADNRLGALVSVDLKDPKVENVLSLLRKATGLKLTTGGRIDAIRPAFTTLNARSVNAWYMMDLLAKSKAVQGTWVRTDGDYELVGASAADSPPQRELVQPRVFDAGCWATVVSLAVLLAGGAWMALRRRRAKAVTG